MRITLATDFDKEKHKEVFQTITITQTSAKQLIEERLNNLDYDERQGFVRDFAVKSAKKKKRVKKEKGSWWYGRGPD